LLDWEVANRELTIEHTGDRYFVVWVFDLESGLYDTIADEVGDYESTDPLPPNTSIIQVNAIGERSLTVALSRRQSEVSTPIPTGVGPSCASCLSRCG